MGDYHIGNAVVIVKAQGGSISYLNIQIGTQSNKRFRVADRMLGNAKTHNFYFGISRMLSALKQDQIRILKKTAQTYKI